MPDTSGTDKQHEPSTPTLRDNKDGCGRVSRGVFRLRVLEEGIGKDKTNKKQQPTDRHEKNFPALSEFVVNLNKGNKR